MGIEFESPGKIVEQGGTASGVASEADDATGSKYSGE
jgi:hypothetical protein